MQKALLLPIIFSALFLATINQASAQCIPSLDACTLKVSTDPLCMIPDTNEMPPGFYNFPYDRHIHFIFEDSFTVTENPATGDTLPFPVSATLGFMIFDSIGGLPPGISYAMYSGNSLDPPGKFSAADGNKAFGCIHLYGTPTQANNSATNGATIYMRPYGCVFGGILCDSIPWSVTYRVPIALPQIIHAPLEIGFRVISHVQDGKLQVDFHAERGCLSEFVVTDVTGRTILSTSIPATQGGNETFLPFSGAKGFYILRVITPYGVSTKRFAW